MSTSCVGTVSHDPCKFDPLLTMGKSRENHESLFKSAFTKKGQSVQRDLTLQNLCRKVAGKSTMIKNLTLRFKNAEEDPCHSVEVSSDDLKGETYLIPKQMWSALLIPVS